MTWGGKREGCGRKKKDRKIREDHRSKELKTKMKWNTEINDKYFAKQKGGK